MPVSPTQVVLAAALVATFAGLWYFEGRGRWRALAEDRLLYGVPWGTLLTVAAVVAFYLFAQSGYRTWSDPVIYPFVSWSFFYPLGILTAGIAHGGPAHLVSNMAGTLALAPIAEYAWGHYARGHRSASEASANGEDASGEEESGEEESGEVSRADGTIEEEHRHEDDLVVDGGATAANSRSPEAPSGLLADPWVRALVIFPAALFAAALLTSVYSMGPGLGFSGAVYAILGFALLTYPLTTVVAVVVAAALGTLYDALTQPFVTATVEVGTPGPPSWAGIGFQAHALGFLLGVLAAVALLAIRHRRPAPDRVFLATLAVGLVQGLWLVAWSGDDVYYLYRGVGVVAMLVVILLVAVAVAASDDSPPGPSGRLLGGGTLVLAALTVLGAAGTGILVAGIAATWIVPVVLLGALLAGPGLASFALSGRPIDTDRRRKAGVALLVAIAVAIALPSLLLGSAVVGADAVPNDDGVTVGGYTVTYAEDAPLGLQLPGVDAEDVAESTVSGVIVANPDREVWTVAVQDYVLEHEGTETVQVGGVGWNESIHVERSGWEVAGGEVVYAVDLAHDGERTRSFASDAATAQAAVAGHSFEVAPTDDAFEVRVAVDGDVVGTAPVPDANESTTVGEVALEADSDGDARRLYAVGPDGRALVAVEETY